MCAHTAAPGNAQALTKTREGAGAALCEGSVLTSLVGCHPPAAGDGDADDESDGPADHGGHGRASAPLWADLVETPNSSYAEEVRTTAIARWKTVVRVSTAKRILGTNSFCRLAVGFAKP